MNKINFSLTRTFKKTLAWSGLAAVSLSMLALPVLAADFRAQNGSESSSLQIPADTITRNLYAVGAVVNINANPEKDLVAAGGTVNVNGDIGDDLILAGGTLNVRGDIGGSARILGGNVYIESPIIAEDLLIAGGTVYIHANTTIEGDLIIGGGDVVVDGNVLGNVKAGGSNVAINGMVEGNIDAKISRLLEFGPNAEVKGNVTYSSPLELRRDAGASILGTVSYTPFQKNSRGFPILTVFFVVRLLAALLVTLVIFAVFRNSFSRMTRSVGDKFWANAGIGLVGIIVVPVLIALLFISIIGYVLALLLLAMFAVALILSSLIGAAYFGSWVVAKIDRKEMKIDYVTVILGVVLVSVLRFVPLLGWLLCLVLLVAGFGAVLKALGQARKQP